MVTIDVPVYCGSNSPDHLKQIILRDLKSPILFKDTIKSWSNPLTWTPEQICRNLTNVTTTFKVCPKKHSPYYKTRFSDNEVLFETDCNYIEAKYKDMLLWYNEDADYSSDAEPKAKRVKTETDDACNLSRLYPRTDYWMYADYKYMSHLCVKHEVMIKSIDWSVFGFNGRNGNDSTLWVGSEDASTPCHYDTYGCNLVAQLSGRKKWTLFSPLDTERLYPTRVPYEESSVFSSVNITNPNLTKFPLFKDASPHQIVLMPGDVLFVPFHWWHYVECMEPAVSVNTWIDLPEDNIERVKEAIVRTLVSSLVCEDNSSHLPPAVNPNEVLFSQEENLKILNTVLQRSEESSIKTADLINTITNEQVLEKITNILTQKKEDTTRTSPSRKEIVHDI